MGPGRGLRDSAADCPLLWHSGVLGGTTAKGPMEKNGDCTALITQQNPKHTSFALLLPSKSLPYPPPRSPSQFHFALLPYPAFSLLPSPAERDSTIPAGPLVSGKPQRLSDRREL